MSSYDAPSDDAGGAGASSSSASSAPPRAASLEGLHTFDVMGTAFTVDRRYAPIKALGKGAYGVVVAARNRETGAKVAIKKIAPMCATAVDGKHTLREIRLMRWLGKHANVIGLKDLIVGAPPLDELYVVMELFDTDLHRIIQSPQALGDAHYKHFLFQLLRGLRFAHAHGVLHRDLQPANLLVTKNCDLCISDFGLARQVPQGMGGGAGGGAAGGAGAGGNVQQQEPDILMTEHVVTRWYRAPERECVGVAWCARGACARVQREGARAAVRRWTVLRRCGAQCASDTGSGFVRARA